MFYFGPKGAELQLMPQRDANQPRVALSRQKGPANRGLSERVSEGTRTPDRLDHNQELYQLSYAHRGIAESTSGSPEDPRPRQETQLSAAHALLGEPLKGLAQILLCRARIDRAKA